MADVYNMCRLFDGYPTDGKYALEINQSIAKWLRGEEGYLSPATCEKACEILEKVFHHIENSSSLWACQKTVPELLRRYSSVDTIKDPVQYLSDLDKRTMSED